MALPEPLTHFVKESLGRGVARPEIRSALHRAGWSGEQIDRSLDAYSEIEFPVPVPRPQPYLSAKEAFLYLLLFTALYLSAFELGSLLFELIEQAFPDPTDTLWEGRREHEIRWAIATLVVAFPLYLTLGWFLGRAMRRDPTKRASKVRKWLTYMTMMIAAGFLLGDFITLVYNFLGGEMTTRFALKVLTIAVIAGAVLIYYLLDMRREEREA